MKAKSVGRPRIGMPRSIALNETLEEWIDSKVEAEGGSFCAMVRDLLEKQRQHEIDEKRQNRKQRKSA